MTRINVGNIRHPDASADSIQLSSAGRVTLDGIAYPSAGPLSNRNLIINGAMQVAQRGTSGTANGDYAADRFSSGFSGGAITISQESLTSGDPYDAGFRNFARLTNTAAASGATDHRRLTQFIEAQNMANSGWNYASATSYVTLSFWIRSSVSQAFIVRLRSEDGTSQNYPMSTGTLTADTWTKITKTIPGNSNVAFDNDNGRGLRVEFAAFWGTDYTDSGVSLDTWAAYSASTRAPDMTSTWAGTTNATFDVTGVQLEVGSVATPFEHRSYGDELARCQRYYQHFATDTSAAVYIGMGISAGSTSARMFMPLAVPMRTTPSVTENGASADDQISSTYALSSPSVIASCASTVRVEFTTSGMTNGRPIQLQVGTGESITLSAEL